MSVPSVGYNSQHKHEPPTLLNSEQKARKPIDDGSDSSPVQDSKFKLDHPSSNDSPNHQFRVHVSESASTDDLAQVEADQDFISRPGSATSSLDPYYFGAQTPSDSPALQLPEPTFLSTTPETCTPHEPLPPLTPARDPASIDRKGLVGVGELATPRWGKSVRRAEESHDNQDDNVLDVLQEEDSSEVMVPHVGNDGPDSPWTIEAVDGEFDNMDELEAEPVARTIRPRRSMPDESGGEEILYPRQPHGSDLLHPLDRITASSPSPEEPPSPLVPPLPTEQSLVSDVSAPSSPPSAFAPLTPLRKAKKRTSDEFETDQSGSLVAKRLGLSSTLKDRSVSISKDDKSSVRKHRSASSTASSRDRRLRESLSTSASAQPSSGVPQFLDSTLVPITNPARTDRERNVHSRQLSAGDSSSGPDPPPLVHPRRVHTTDFSHLPPSPSTTSIHQFLKHSGNATSSTAPLHIPSLSNKESSHSHSPNVAHSLLRGTQEGWSSMDDETLRKLDGLSGKTARARASVGSLNRPTSMSRPGTPGSTTGRTAVHWEGVGNESGKISRRGSIKEKERKDERQPTSGLGISGSSGELVAQEVNDARGYVVTSADEHPSSSGPEKTSKKHGSISARLSFTPKRGSASSTTYTTTPTSSRDSASLSTTTSATSVSGPSGSGRQSTGIGKGRRNSAGSDISSVYSGGDAAQFKDRAGSLAAGAEALEEGRVPPVPPLPKDLSNYRSPPQSSHGVAFPPSGVDDSDVDRMVSLEVPSTSKSSLHSHASANCGHCSAPETALAVTKTPSKKWSFSNALNIKLTSSPSISSMRDKDHSPSNSKTSSFPLSPRSMQSFGQQLRKSTSREHALSPPVAPHVSWSPVQPDAMASAASLASMSSIGSTRAPKSPAILSAKTPDCERGFPTSRPGTGSSGSNNTTALSAPQHAPLSPSSSMRRHQSKRLTPSSIPFFRRSSSQSMQIPPTNTISMSGSPTMPSAPVRIGQNRVKASTSPNKDSSRVLPATPASAQKKSSVLSLGLPSLLKSSSRRSLHGDKSDTGMGKDTPRQRDTEKEKSKQDSKNRSESRISVLMGRKRGKTLSSTDPKKANPAVTLPPMQMAALPATTAQRVANLKTNSNSLSTPTVAPSISRTASSSRVTSQTVSSMQKQSDTSLRTRNQLPTIAGSPSVGTTGYSASKDAKDGPPSVLLNSMSGLPKETPTKIPRISSRTSAAGSPGLTSGQNTLVSRRISLNVTAPSTDPSPTLGEAITNEFGVLENADMQGGKTTAEASSRRQSVRISPTSGSRVPRQVSGPPSAGGIPRKSNRDSVSFSALRKASTGSVASTASVAAQPSESSHVHHRFSALSPSKSLKLLSPKISLPTSRSSNSNNNASTSGAHRAHAGTPSSSRQSLSTPSPVPSTMDEEELLGDEEMLQYIRRQQAKKMATGATQEELDELLKFPEPIPPTPGLTPEEVLRGSQAQFLSAYEREEILNYPRVYTIGASSQKKQAHADIPTNNFGYDDDRGDYLVVNGDHLAYRYEVVDTLGKGSFGQVLNCRDHQTGESVAIKIIRNKKRFHHQALVEIKILDNLRKWDQEEKHHVIKMTEHFYFRNHLCIAMELLSINLYELIKANGFVGFTTTLIRRFTSQMIMSLCLMRHHRIVHCDLKPENVLLKHPAKSAIKVIDFGSSCFEHEKIYTYIQSRFYRSPEVILGMNYHMAIDMWSLGCILAELYTGFPIFPGENEQEQLSCIMEVLGPPDKDFINRSSRKRLFFDNNCAPRPVVNSKGRRRRPGTKSLAHVLRCQDEDFVDFIARCLVWDPERRMKPQAALQHNFLKASRRNKVTTPSSATAKAMLSSSSLSGISRSNKVTETPKKSQISAPTPLTARSSRTTITNGVTSTPFHSTSMSSTSRTYRSSQSHGLSSQYSNRTFGLAVSRPSSSDMPLEQELMSWLQATAAK
ncbi:hypothetical protein PAXRUDRAFT_129338 [Paxillus rubicundulus Ve08.2h10]|uniref:dual-specificity kinase n=1 Tax=Paxillus rubicundulus Ve08.2h10 TaxID=930991 RepID=A0A0D0DY52_9AGAM|nr:hypothetical protein PAXRUDRAFT_129338 [Paxillus rubicundulus Ve08.2h10]